MQRKYKVIKEIWKSIHTCTNPCKRLVTIYNRKADCPFFFWLYVPTGDIMAKVKSWPIHIFIMLTTPISLTEMPSISINDFINIT